MNFTTSIGSLPFLSCEKACAFAFEFDLPFFPELPHLCPNEFMIKRLEHFYQTQDSSQKCDEAFKKMVLLKKPSKIKWQVVDPFTLFKYQGLKLSFEEVLKLLQNYIKKRLLFFRSFYQGEIVLFLDAPAMDFNLKNGQFLKNFLSSFKQEKIKTGLHLCQKLEKSIQADELLFDYLSFDYLLNPDYALESLRSVAGLLIFGIYDYQTSFLAKGPQIGPYDGLSSVCGLYGANEEEILTFLSQIKQVKFLKTQET